MTHKDDQVYVEHMLECIDRINKYTARERARFNDSTLIQDAVTRNMQILTESSQRLSDALKANHPEIPWRDIAGFRNVLVHDYLGLDLDVIWSVVELDLPDLYRALQKMRASS